MPAAIPQLLAPSFPLQLPRHADAEADDARRDDAADVVRGSVADDEPARAWLNEYCVRRRDMIGVRVGQVEDVHARDEAHAAELERLVHAEVRDEQVRQAHVAERVRAARCCAEPLPRFVTRSAAGTDSPASAGVARDVDVPERQRVHPLALNSHLALVNTVSTPEPADSGANDAPFRFSMFVGSSTPASESQ